ncbi:hypothetical protein Tco_0723743 [Tanacetum coccineum]
MILYPIKSQKKRLGNFLEIQKRLGNVSGAYPFPPRFQRERIAEVAAAKARMFVNKPDGMVREERGPYSDPQHPYLYEGEDVWMAPGFINQFCEVPDYWKAYIEDVDEERKMWINSFYKAPLRLPMPAELEYWWEKDESPEFVLLNKEPEPDPEDPEKKVYTEDPVILHTPTGRIINYVDDEEHGIRLFWQPPLKDGEDVDPSKVEFLPLGDEELFERDDRSNLERTLSSFQDKCKLMLENLEKWSEDRKKESEAKLKLIETEIEIVEAESELKEIIKDMDDELKRLEKEEEKKIEMGLEEEDEPIEKVEEVSRDEVKDNAVVVEDEEEEEEEEDDDDDDIDEDEDDESTPPSFESADKNKDLKVNDQKGKKGGRSSPFAACSLQFGSVGLASMVPSQLQQVFMAWKESKWQTKTYRSCSASFNSLRASTDQSTRKSSIEFERAFDQGLTLRAHHKVNKCITRSSLGNRCKHKASAHLERNTDGFRRCLDFRYVCWTFWVLVGIAYSMDHLEKIPMTSKKMKDCLEYLVGSALGIRAPEVLKEVGWSLGEAACYVIWSCMDLNNVLIGKSWDLCEKEEFLGLHGKNLEDEAGSRFFEFILRVIVVMLPLKIIDVIRQDIVPAQDSKQMRLQLHSL